MKLLALLLAAATLAGCANLPPIKARLCYTDPKTGDSVCLSAAPDAITIAGNAGATHGPLKWDAGLAK